jgi:CHAT domain-containing protein
MRSRSSADLVGAAPQVLVLWLAAASLITGVARSSSLRPETSTEPGATPLLQGMAVNRRLAGGPAHNYTVELTPGDVARVGIIQMGLDVKVRVSIPGVAQELWENGLQTSRGKEVVVAAADVAGTLHLAVQAFDDSATEGAYEIVLEELTRSPSPTQLATARAWLRMAKAAYRSDSAEGGGQEQVSEAAEAVMLWRQAGDRRGEAEALYLQGLVLDQQGKMREAIERFTEALKLQQALEQSVAQAVTLSDRGTSHDDLGQPAEALADLEAARDQFHQLQDARGEARALLNLASVHDKKGEHARASEEYLAVREICRALGDRRCQAAALNNLGRIQSLNGEPQEALAHYSESLELWQALTDRRNSAWTIMNIGAVEESIGLPREALGHYASALQLNRDTGDRRGEAFTLHNRAAANADIGETQQALDDYQQALRVWRETADRRGEATTLSNLAKLSADLGETMPALDLYRQSLALHQASQAKYSEAGARYQLGRLYESLGRFEDADEQYTSALALWRQTGSRRRTGLALAARGSIALAAGHPETALALQQEAIATLREAQNLRGEAEALTSLALTLAALGRTPEALEQLDAALSIERKVGDRAAEADTLFKLATLAKRAGDDVAAQAAVEQALDRVNQLRARVMTSNLRTKYLLTKRRYVRFLIDLLMDQAKRHPGKGFDQQAFLVNEEFVARNLLESLALRGTDLRPDAGAELVKREQDLVTRVAALDLRQTRLVDRDDEEQAAKVERQLQELLRELDRVQTEILQQSPHYADLTQPDTLTIEEIQSHILDANTLLLEYSLGPDKSFLWIISKSAVRSAELPPRAVVEGVARELLDLLRRGPQPLAEGRLTRSAAVLGKMILGPAGDLHGVSRLLIVPDGALQRVPFSLLIPPSGPHEPLVVRHEPVLLPSVSVLAALRRPTLTATSDRRDIAVFADPVFRRDDPRLAATFHQTTGETPGLPDPVARSIEDFDDKSLPRLPETRKEAESIQALLPHDRVFLALSFDARKSLLLDGSLRNPRVLHFATHALLNEKHPELSGLVLSLIDRQGRAQDGFLRLTEIYNLHLSSDLVVLSACRTAIGPELEGEGLLGLTRGFFHAGASAVIASLWKVDDRATAELMKRTYRKMFTDGLPPSAALRAAQASMSTDGWHPYDWAGFVFQGDWLPVPRSSK